MLSQFNEWLVAQLDVEHAVGHSAFLNASLANVSAAEAIQRAWARDVRPLLEEYFFGQPDRLRAAEVEWRRLRAEAAEEDDGETAGDGHSI